MIEYLLCCLSGTVYLQPHLILKVTSHLFCKFPKFLGHVVCAGRVTQHECWRQVAPSSGYHLLA